MTEVRKDQFHPLVETTRLALVDSKPDDYGRVHPTRKDCFQISVKPNTVARALTFLDLLFRALEDRKYRIHIRQEKLRTVRRHRWDKEEVTVSHYPEVIIAGQGICLTIEEPTRRKYNGGSLSYPSAGGLVLVAGSYPRHSRIPDARAAGPLELRIDHVIKRLVSLAVSMRRDAFEASKRRLKEEPEQRKAELKRARQEVEREWEQELLEDFKVWKRSQELLAFIEFREKNLNPSARNQPMNQQWFKWARDYARTPTMTSDLGQAGRVNVRRKLQLQSRLLRYGSLS